MDNFQVIDVSFDINITTSYFLSIQIFLDGFSFCVLDPVSNHYIQLKHRKIEENQTLAKALNEEFSNNDLLVYPYKKVFCLSNSPYNTIVPNALFKKEALSDYLKFTHSDYSSDLNEKLCFNKIKMADSWSVFTIPKEIDTIFKKYYQEIIYLHKTTPFIETALINDPIGEGHNQVYIDIFPNHFDILVTFKNDLKLQNSFKFKDLQDFLYFVLLIFDQLKLSPANTDVFLSGIISSKSEIYKLLKQYIKKVHISTLPTNYAFPSVFKDLNTPFFNNLFNLPQCV